MQFKSRETIQFDEQKKWRGRLWRYAPLIFWIVVIFVASSRVGSMSNTSVFIRPILELLFPNYAEAELAIVHGYIRKFAHFAFYFILGAFSVRAFRGSAQNFLRRYWQIAAFALVVSIAYLDETNQSYVASRTSSMSDVLIDACGGAAAILIWLAVGKIKSRDRR